MVRWVVVGVGDISTRRVLPAIAAEPRSALYGVVSRDGDKGRAWSGRVWLALEDALRDPSVDAVYVATPPFLHAAQSMAAMRAGRHVLCEKPMARNYAEAAAMVRTAAATGRQLGVAYYRRFYPKLRRARELLRCGAVGRPVLAELSCHSWRDGAEASRSWLVDPALAGGGPLFDIASHRIDVLNFLLGRPRRVSAQLSNAVHRYAVEDSATVLIEYEGGGRGVVDVRWHTRQPRDECRIIGTDGELELSPLNGPVLSGPAGVERLPPPPNPHLPLVQNFVAAVLDGAELVSSGETALATDAVTEAALAANRNAVEVVLPGADH